MTRLQKIAFIFVPMLVPMFAGAADGQNCNSLIGFCNPLSSDTICGALKLFLNALLSVGVPIAVLFLVYAGFRFIWARGNPEGLAKARTNLLYVIIGIGIFMGAWLLGQIMANTLSSIAPGNGIAQIGQCV